MRQCSAKQGTLHYITPIAFFLVRETVMRCYITAPVPALSLSLSSECNPNGAFLSCNSSVKQASQTCISVLALFLPETKTRRYVTQTTLAVSLFATCSLMLRKCACTFYEKPLQGAMFLLHFYLFFFCEPHMHMAKTYS